LCILNIAPRARYAFTTTRSCPTRASSECFAWGERNRGLVGFGGLTAVVFTTKKDFSFLGAFLRWAGIGALLMIGAGLVFGFQLGTFFSVGMIVFAGAAILYDTSNVMLSFPEDRYVAAALQLFASIALMFWYVLRLFISRR